MKIPAYIRKKVLFPFSKTGNTDHTMCERWHTHTKSQGQDSWDRPGRCGLVVEPVDQGVTVQFQVRAHAKVVGSIPMVGVQEAANQ